MLEHAGDDYDHNASDHSANRGPATSSRFTNDNNDAHERRRLLIARPVAVASVAHIAV